MSGKLYRCRRTGCPSFAAYYSAMGTRRGLHLCPRHAREFRQSTYHAILRIYSTVQPARHTQI